MEDFSAMLQNLLQTEEGKQGLEQAMQMLGGNKSTSENDSSPPKQDQTSDSPSLPFNPQMLLQLQSLMSQVPSHDKNTDFLLALKPLLREKKQTRVNEAIRMMKLFSMLPILQQNGLLKNLLNFGE